MNAWRVTHKIHRMTPPRMKSTESMDLPKNARNHSDKQQRSSLWSRAFVFKKCCIVVIPYGEPLWFHAFLCLLHVLAETLMVFHRVFMHFFLWCIVHSFWCIIVMRCIFFSIHTHSTLSAPPRTLHTLSHCKHAPRPPRTTLQKRIWCFEKLETVLTEHVLYWITRDTFTPHTVVHTRTPTRHTIYMYHIWCARIHSTHAHTCTLNRAQRAHCRRHMCSFLNTHGVHSQRHIVCTHSVRAHYRRWIFFFQTYRHYIVDTWCAFLNTHGVHSEVHTMCILEYTWGAFLDAHDVYSQRHIVWTHSV